MTRIEEIKKELLDQSDGPVTKFSAILRAVWMASRHDEEPDFIAEALQECLETDLKDGDLPSNEFPQSSAL